MTRSTEQKYGDRVADLRNTAARLVNLLKSDQGNVPFHVLLIIDEAHTLTVDEPLSGRSRLLALDHVLKDLKGSEIFTMYLSTYTQIDRLAPSKDRHPSFRGGADDALFPPLTEFICFDLQTKKIAEKLFADGVTLEKISSPAYVTSFGRAA